MHRKSSGSLSHISSKGSGSPVNKKKETTGLGLIIKNEESPLKLPKITDLSPRTRVVNVVNSITNKEILKRGEGAVMNSVTKDNFKRQEVQN